MKPRLSKMWDTAAPIIVGIAVVVGIAGGAYGIEQARLANSVAVGHTGQISQQTDILKRLEQGAKTRTAEIASLQRSNDIGAVILKDAALEEEYLSEQEHNICVATPGCVLVPAPALLAIPQSIPLPSS